MIRPQPTTAPTTRPSRPPTHTLTLSTSSTFTQPALKALLHTLFFHRLFPAVRPLTRDIAFPPPSPPSKTPTRIHPTPSHPHHTAYTSDPPTITHPLVDDADVETAISERAGQLAKSVDRALRSDAGRVEKTVRVHFYEKKRKKAATGFAGFWKEQGSGEVNGVCWESWEICVVAQDSQGRAVGGRRYGGDGEEEEGGEALVRRSVKSLRKAMMDVIRVAGEEKEHIPPITSAESNPFPYEIVVEGR